MTNNFEKMMETMMEKYMEKVMENMMTNMFSNMLNTPEVAKAEVEEKKKNTMSIEELLAMDTTFEEEVNKPTTTAKLDFVVEDFKPKNSHKSRKGIRYNQFTTKSVWTYNHLMIRKNYPNVKYSNGHYYCDTLSELQQFASSYHIVSTLNNEQLATVKAYWDSRKNNK